MDLKTIVQKFYKQLNTNNVELKFFSFLLNSSTEDCDRIKFTTEYLEKFNLLPKLTKSYKYNQLSVKYREEGNAHFFTKKLYDALESYNKAIGYAEMANGTTECLSLAYANRSAILFRLGYYRECIQDIKKALELDYPTDKVPKLQTRETKAKDLLENTKPNLFWTDISDDMIPNKNDIVKCASDKVQLSYNTQHDRSVVAAEDIELGELIAIEKPYVTVLELQQLYTNCYNCLRYTFNLIPCDQCPYALFCSENCKQQAKIYHQFECQLMGNLIQLNECYLLAILRVIFTIRNDLGNVIKIMSGQTDYRKCGLTFENGKYVFDTNYAPVYAGNVNTDKYSLKKIIEYTVNGAVLLNLLKQINFFNVTDRDSAASLDHQKIFKIISTLFLRHEQNCRFAGCIKVSHISVAHNNSEDWQICCTGTGIYPFIGLLKHSCDPNVYLGFRGDKLIVAASRPIKKGEQLNVCYSVRYDVQAKPARAQRLHKFGILNCKCRACVENWPTLDEMAATGRFRRNVSPEMKYFIAEIRNTIRNGIKDLVEARQNLRKYLPGFKKYLKELENCRPCFQFTNLQRALQIFFEMEGNIVPQSETENDCVCLLLVESLLPNFDL